MTRTAIQTNSYFNLDSYQNGEINDDNCSTFLNAGVSQSRVVASNKLRSLFYLAANVPLRDKIPIFFCSCLFARQRGQLLGQSRYEIDGMVKDMRKQHLFGEVKNHVDFSNRRSTSYGWHLWLTMCEILFCFVIMNGNHRRTSGAFQLPRKLKDFASMCNKFDKVATVFEDAKSWDVLSSHYFILSTLERFWGWALRAFQNIWADDQPLQYVVMVNFVCRSWTRQVSNRLVISGAASSSARNNIELSISVENSNCDD